ncbi:MAG: tripartite tricarboxylate transporter substrate binding protein [Alphaproteobacteria bacterium]|nr:tripartite tricarboxylate transporter substrate binding protein [Alphaproteobacteria bacterium]
MRIPRRAALSLLASPAFAQSWPNRPLRIIVPFPPGGGVDLTARLLSEPLARELGQTVVIENRGGAGGVIGVEAMSRAPADGYTLSLTGAGTITAGPHLRRLPYDALGLAHVTMLVRMPFIVAVRSDLPARTLPEFLALARQGGLRYASGGPGTSQHLTGELFNQMAGLAMEHVPYRGTGPALNDLAARVVDVYYGDPATLALISSGQARAMAVTSAQRWSLLPDTPAVKTGMGWPRQWARRSQCWRRSPPLCSRCSTTRRPNSALMRQACTQRRWPAPNIPPFCAPIPQSGAVWSPPAISGSPTE